MLKIRLTRIGTKKRPFYRVIVKEERSKRDGDFLELLGTYNPLTEPKDIKLKQDRIDHWIKQGAQMSTGFLRIIGKAPQRKPRKPKKEKVSKEAEVSKVSEVKEEPKESEELKVTEEKPVEETVPVSELSETPAQSDSTDTQSPSENEESTK